MPNTIRAPDGGTSEPSVPPAASAPAAKPGWYLARRISGRAAAPTVATVARLEPLMAPKPAHPAMDASARPPRRCPTKRAATSKKSRLAPAAKHKCAMSRNSGRTPSSYFITVSKATTPPLITAASGEISTARPSRPTPASPTPMGTPAASRASSAAMPKSPTSSGLIARSGEGRCARTAGRRRAARRSAAGAAG